MHNTLCLGFLAAALPWSGAWAAEGPAAGDAGPPPQEKPRSGPAATAGWNSLLVKDFRFSGNNSVSGAELKQLLAGYLDQPCDLKQLREAADRVSDEYRRRGLDFTKAYVPAQAIRDGVVEIVVVEGRVGEIKVEGNRNYSGEFIQGFLRESLADGAVSSEGLERGLLLLNSEFTDLRVTANLERSQIPGAVDLRAKVEDSSPLHLSLSANNFGSEFVSRHRFGAQIDWTNALISGALLSLGGMVGEKPDNLAYGTGAYVAPVNALGTKVGINGAYGNFTVGSDFADLGIHNKEVGGGIFVSHPFIEKRALVVLSELGFRSRDAKFYLLDQLTSHDKVRLVYGELRGSHQFWGGKSLFSFNLSQGLGDWLGGTDDDDPMASRFEADNLFTRITPSYTRLQPLNETFSVIARLAGQWSSDSLLASEEWQVGGADSVRGYSPGEAAGDLGYRATLEFRVAPLEKKEMLQLGAFIDHGAASRREVLPGGDKNEAITGAGLGCYSYLKYYVPVSLRLEVGWPLKPSTNSLDEDPVFYFSLTTRY